jgi:dolichyl-phosphate-mannose--protein O-mannosyl transferase
MHELALGRRLIDALFGVCLVLLLLLLVRRLQAKLSVLTIENEHLCTFGDMTHLLEI